MLKGSISRKIMHMHFKPDELKAFASVEYIMRDVNWGWSKCSFQTLVSGNL
jgi:quinol-cytochrome oxidoreductase complex cytochrome b subunit